LTVGWFYEHVSSSKLSRDEGPSNKIRTLERSRIRVFTPHHPIGAALFLYFLTPHQSSSHWRCPLPVTCACLNFWKERFNNSFQLQLAQVGGLVLHAIFIFQFASGKFVLLQK
jgi:hypothetical protein